MKSVLVRLDQKRYPVPTRPIPHRPTLAIRSLLYTRNYRATADGQKSHGEKFVQFFSHPVAFRRIIYTENAFEQLECQLRKIVNNPATCPNDTTVDELLRLTVRDMKVDTPGTIVRKASEPGIQRQPLG